MINLTTFRKFFFENTTQFKGSIEVLEFSTKHNKCYLADDKGRISISSWNDKIREEDDISFTKSKRVVKSRQKISSVKLISNESELIVGANTSVYLLKADDSLQQLKEFPLGKGVVMNISLIDKNQKALIVAMLKGGLWTLDIKARELEKKETNALEAYDLKNALVI